MVTRGFLIMLEVQWGQWGCTLDGYKGTMNSHFNSESVPEGYMPIAFSALIAELAAARASRIQLGASTRTVSVVAGSKHSGHDWRDSERGRDGR